MPDNLPKQTNDSTHKPTSNVEIPNDLRKASRHFDPQETEVCLRCLSVEQDNTAGNWPASGSAGTAVQRAACTTHHSVPQG
jgi:hypothetical protein